MLGPAKIRIGIMPALAAAAGRTRRLKSGMAVLVLPLRSPLLTANGLVTLELLPGGRVFPAAGVGVRDPRDGKRPAWWRVTGVPGRTRRSKCSETTT